MMALPQNFPQDPFIRLAGEYTKQPSPYGPLWELVAQIPMQLGITSIGAGVIAMKVISLISYIGMAFLLGWYASQQSPRYEVGGLTAMTFFALNPLVMLQAIGNGHNDMLLITLMTLGLILWQREKWMWAAIALTCATLVKITGLIFMPLFGMAVLVAAPDWKTRFTRGLGVAVTFIALTLLAYRLTGPLPAAFEGTKYAMLNRLGYTPSYMIRIFLIYFYPPPEITKLPTTIGNYLFLIYYVYLLIRLAQKKLTLLEAGFSAFFVQLFLGSTFRIWYPMWLIPFAALNLNSWTYWRTFLFGITAEFSILSYYVLWRWVLHHWPWAENLFKRYWDYWLVMTWFTVPWTFGIPWLGPLLRRRKNRQVFEDSLSI
jgi:Gpi18-like mannosyltransferase